MRVSSVWHENWYSGVLQKSTHACEKVLRTFDVSSRFSENIYFLLDFLCISQMCIFHEKIITFLFVSLSRTIKFSSNFCRRVKYNRLSEYVHLNAKWYRSRGFFLKTWNFHCTRTSKNWKIHDFSSVWFSPHTVL